jgi:hypothetical protein
MALERVVDPLAISQTCTPISASFNPQTGCHFVRTLTLGCGSTGAASVLTFSHKNSPSIRLAAMEPCLPKLESWVETNQLLLVENNHAFHSRHAFDPRIEHRHPETLEHFAGHQQSHSAHGAAGLGGDRRQVPPRSRRFPGNYIVP